VVEEQRFPRWVEDRFSHRETRTRRTNEKEALGLVNLPQVAVSAKGNGIGIINDLMTPACCRPP
jgi:hypothetical protein